MYYSHSVYNTLNHFPVMQILYQGSYSNPRLEQESYLDYQTSGAVDSVDSSSIRSNVPPSEKNANSLNGKR